MLDISVLFNWVTYLSSYIYTSWHVITVMTLFSVSLHYGTLLVSLKGSWKIKIRDRLEHMQRPSKRDINDKENQPDETPSKRRNKGPNRLNEATEEVEPKDEQSFSDNVKEMQCETVKRKPNDSHLKPLMDATFSGRRHWVKTEMTPVSTIMEKFPAHW